MALHHTGRSLRKAPSQAGGQPRLTVAGPSAGARAVVLLLHGGRASGVEAAPRGLEYLRMLPFMRAAAGAPPGGDVATWLLRYRVRGWNAPTMHPLQDAHWALAEARRLHPGAPVVLVGHSMGGRVALRSAGEPGVVGVCALAPWIEPDEPAPSRTDVSVLIAHGERDTVTDPAVSAAYAGRIGATYVPVPGEGHALIRRPIFWHRLVKGYVASVLGTGHPPTV